MSNLFYWISRISLAFTISIGFVRLVGPVGPMGGLVIAVIGFLGGWHVAAACTAIIEIYRLGTKRVGVESEID